MSIETLKQAVQFNCDLSDRESAADYSICIYLIRMREYYRWSHGIAMNEPLDQSTLMDWVSNTEARWEAIEVDGFQALEFQGVSYQAFDSEPLNRVLQPLGYTYSAGYGRFAKPVFMLAELQSFERTDRYKLTIAGRELARELSAPPAVMQSGNILIRTESVARLIWDLLEEWQWSRPDNAMARVVEYYDFEADALLALERASIDQREVLILHEIGELIAEDLLAPGWNEMLIEKNRHRHLFARAVRDTLADCLSTLPGLVAEDNRPGIHFYFASLTPLRKSMFPMLAKAYRQWHSSGSFADINSAISRGQVHWLKTANSLRDEFDASRERSKPSLQGYVEQNAL
ncbi:MAG: hypothetical protein GY726_03085 [Proteobacteria bacterium]|nr:hypothetical protein [Pseudomonadota bacterium]